MNLTYIWIRFHNTDTTQTHGWRELLKVWGVCRSSWGPPSSVFIHVCRVLLKCVWESHARKADLVSRVVSNLHRMGSEPAAGRSPASRRNKSQRTRGRWELTWLHTPDLNGLPLPLHAPPTRHQPAGGNTPAYRVCSCGRRETLYIKVLIHSNQFTHMPFNQWNHLISDFIYFYIYFDKLACP